MDKGTFLELLDKYFEGTLLPEEKLAFSKAMEDNSEYKEEFEMEQAIKNSVILLNRKKLKEKLEAIRELEEKEGADDDKEHYSIETTFIKNPFGYKKTGTDVFYDMASPKTNNKFKTISNRSIGILVSIAAILIVAVIIFVINLNSHNEELLFSGSVSFSNYSDNEELKIIKETYDKEMNSSGIKDFPDSNSKETFSARDSINRRIDLLGYDLAHKKINFKLYYFNNKQGYKIQHDTIFIYINSKELRTIDKIELGINDTLKIFTNDKVYNIIK